MTAMKSMRTILLAASLLPLLALAKEPLAPEWFPAWQWRSKVAAGSAISSPYVVLELPSEIFSYLKPDLADLRVGRGEREVPYVLTVERESDTSTRLTARMFNLSSVFGETTSFVLDLGSSGMFHNAVTIETSSENFRRIVEIQGSNDQTSWRTLNPRGQIFDYTVRDIKPVAVRDTRVSYPEATFRYLLVRIFDQGEPPLKITGASVSRRVATAAREVSYTPTIEVRENDEERATDVIADLGSRGIPHRRARLATLKVNFSRAVTISDSDDQKEWRLLTHGYVFDIRTDRFSGSNLEFSYPESNRRYLKVSILNRDDAPIAVGGLTIYGVVRSILFPYTDTANQGSYNLYLYAGNPEATRPQYDIERISQYVDTATLDRVSAGPIESNPAYVAPVPPTPPLTERSPYLLPVALGVLVAVLAFLLLRLVTRVKALPPPSPPL